MAIAYVNGASGGNGTATSVTLNKPASLAANDILVATIYYEGSGTTLNSLPSGWTSIRKASTSSGNIVNIETCWKRAGGSEPANYTFGISSSQWIIGAIDAWSGCSTGAGVIDANSGNDSVTDNIANPRAASLTTTVANTVLVAGMGNFNGVDITVGTSGFDFERFNLGGTGHWEEPQAAIGASGTKEFAMVSGNAWAVVMIALAPATGAAATSLVIPQHPMHSLLVR